MCTVKYPPPSEGHDAGGGLGQEVRGGVGRGSVAPAVVPRPRRRGGFPRVPGHDLGAVAARENTHRRAVWTGLPL